jgi:hypothetical protein
VGGDTRESEQVRSTTSSHSAVTRIVRHHEQVYRQPGCLRETRCRSLARMPYGEPWLLPAA